MSTQQVSNSEAAKATVGDRIGQNCKNCILQLGVKGFHKGGIHCISSWNY
jgi:hypothetical protein